MADQQNNKPEYTNNRLEVDGSNADINMRDNNDYSVKIGNDPFILQNRAQVQDNRAPTHYSTNNEVTLANGDNTISVEAQKDVKVTTGKGGDHINVFDTVNLTLNTGFEASGEWSFTPRFPAGKDIDNVTINKSQHINVETGADNDGVHLGNSTGNVNTGVGNDYVGVQDTRSKGSKPSDLKIDGGFGNDTFELPAYIDVTSVHSDVLGVHLTTADGAKVVLRGFEHIKYEGKDHGANPPEASNAYNAKPAFKEGFMEP